MNGSHHHMESMTVLNNRFIVREIMHAVLSQKPVGASQVTKSKGN